MKVRLIPAALCSPSGPMIMTLPSEDAASASAIIPGLVTPSSFVTMMRWSSSNAPLAVPCEAR